MKYKQGDILIVPFPFSDLSSFKQRPVLVLSKTEDNEKSEDLITCGITSRLKESSYSIVIDSLSLSEGSIPGRSRVKVDKLFTLSKDIVIKKVARVNQATFALVKTAFTQLV